MNILSASLIVVVVFILIGNAFSLLIPANNINIQYIGRVERGSDYYQFDWPSVRIIAVFEKVTSISIVLNDAPSTNAYWGTVIYYDVIIDNQVTGVLNSTGGGQKSYVIASNLLADIPHSVAVVRRVEPYYGLSKFVGFSFPNNDVIIRTPPPRPNRRLEFLGDSITCGWGIEGHPPCTDQPWVENNLKAFGAVTSNILGADYFVEAESGQGMVRYYGCANITCKDSFPSLYPLTLGGNPSLKWDFSWKPHAVIITLSTNDYGTEPYPPYDIFVDGYSNFVLQQIIPYYGKNITIFTICLFDGPDCISVQNSYENLKSMNLDVVFVSLAGLVKTEDLGCDGHPGVSGELKYATALAPIISKQLGWSFADKMD